MFSKTDAVTLINYDHVVGEVIAVDAEGITVKWSNGNRNELSHELAKKMVKHRDRTATES